jgi:hypothetical protein
MQQKNAALRPGHFSANGEHHRSLGQRPRLASAQRAEARPREGTVQPRAKRSAALGHEHPRKEPCKGDAPAALVLRPCRACYWGRPVTQGGASLALGFIARLKAGRSQPSGLKALETYCPGVLRTIRTTTCAPAGKKTRPQIGITHTKQQDEPSARPKP